MQMQIANLASQSLAFPMLSKEIAFQDDRLLSISKHLHTIITDNMAQVSETKHIEIEAKIGKIVLNPDKVPQGVPDLMSIMLESQYWQVMFPSKIPNSYSHYYNFKPGVQGDPQIAVSEKEIFQTLQQQFTVHFKSETHPQKTKDVVYQLGYDRDSQIRATYEFDTQLKDYRREPLEVLKKTRINDLNIKKGHDNLFLKSDFRISTSFEHTLPNYIPKGYEQQSVRFKERFKYPFQHLTFDLTKTLTTNNRTRQEEENYEVEIEIADFAFLKQNLGNFEDFNRIICRFIQNIGAVTKMIKDIIEVQKQKQALTWKESEHKLQEYTQAANQAYTQLYKNAPRPIVGDYLSAVAYQVLPHRNGQ